MIYLTKYYTTALTFLSQSIFAHSIMINLVYPLSSVVSFLAAAVKQKSEIVAVELISKRLKSHQMHNLRPAKGAFSANYLNPGCGFVLWLCFE